MESEPITTVQHPATNMAYRGGTRLSIAALLPEIIIAGCIGAATIALWFLVLDVIAGRPLYTPTVLGTAFFKQSPEPLVLENLPVSVKAIFEYSMFHGFAFIAIGLFASLFLTLAGKEMNVPMGVMMMFVLFVGLEFGFRLASAILFPQDLHLVLSWNRILIGNLLAAATMGIYLIRRHLLTQSHS
jgi:hypothetical protein